MLRPSIYFTEESVQRTGVDAQVCSRVRYVLAHANNNLKTIQNVSYFHPFDISPL